MKGFMWLTILAVLVLFAACAAPTPQVQVKEVEKIVKETVVVEVEKPSEAEMLSGVVRMGSWDSGDALEPFNNAIASFEEKYPNVDVQLEAVPQEYGTKLLAQFAAGTAPDVYQVGDGDVARFVADGVVEPLDPYINGPNGLDMDIFFPAIADFGKIEGQTMMLTKDYSPLVLYYNKDHFKEAGLDFPNADWTWDDLLNAALELTLDANGNNAKSADFDPANIQRWGIEIPAHWGDVLWLRGILPILYQNGAQLISDDGTTTQGYLNDAKTVEALQWYVDLFKKHHVAPTREDVDAYAGVDMFQSGIVSMVWTGRWPLKDWLKNPEFSFGTMGLPAGPEGKANVLCWAGFAMYSKSENKDAAWAWLKYIAAGEGAQEFARYAFTAVKPIAELQGLDTDPYNAPIVADLENVKPLPEFAHPRWNQCGEKFFREELEKVFLEDKPVQEAMDAAAEQADACLAEE